MTDQKTTPVSDWVERHIDKLSAGSHILDFACGKGRHTRWLMARGFQVTAVDINLSGIADLPEQKALTRLECDLEQGAWPFDAQSFDGIVVTNYLHRPALPHLLESLTIGGVLLYDTFAVGNERFGKPSNPDFLLRPGELLERLAKNMKVLAYDHGPVAWPKPAIRQRLCAIRTD